MPHEFKSSTCVRRLSFGYCIQVENRAIFPLSSEMYIWKGPQVLKIIKKKQVVQIYSRHPSLCGLLQVDSLTQHATAISPFHTSRYWIQILYYASTTCGCSSKLTNVTAESLCEEMLQKINSDDISLESLFLMRHISPVTRHGVWIDNWLTECSFMCK